jgi:hypothetical protein
MAEKSKTQQQVVALEQLASNAEIPVVQGTVDWDSMETNLKSYLEFDSFSRAIEALKPRALYLEAHQFDATERAETMLLSDEDQDDQNDDSDEFQNLRSRKDLSSFLARWEKRNGTTCGVTSVFQFDGILHICTETETWLEQFDSELSDLMGKIDEEDSQRNLAVEEEQSSEIKVKAKKLADHKLFDAPPRSHAKRIYLAERIFPGINQYEIGKIVELAENMAWYAKGAD